MFAEFDHNVIGEDFSIANQYLSVIVKRFGIGFKK